MSETEHPSAMEPLALGADYSKREQLLEMVFALTKSATALHRGLPNSLVPPIAAIVRAMNCYYSNLVEGHNTHPLDVERELNFDHGKDTKRRELQLEARAHISVQKWLDEGGLAAGTETTVAGVQEIHRRFCAELPDALLWVENPDSKERVRVKPGEFRERNVKVGQHVAISAEAVPAFIERFGKFYGSLPAHEAVLAVAAAHHRLLWIHPFMDGNGRVARLVAHSQLLRLLETGGLWSVARGLARKEERYKTLLANCDRPRRNDLDGRGRLSQEDLGSFTQFFLETCLDQVHFMESLLAPKQLGKRILQWARAEIGAGGLPRNADVVLEAVLHRGSLERSEIGPLLGKGDRQGRRVVSALLAAEVLQSESDRSPLRLQFPIRLAWQWLPGLFPAMPD